jgi:rhombotail lipoprotein
MFNLQQVRLLTLVTVLTLSGCVGQQTRISSSVVDYLYPEQSKTRIEPSIPQLKVPLKAGIAFVPQRSGRRAGLGLWATHVGGGSLTEALKADLLDRVARNFTQYEFVSDIEIVPSSYLRPGGGFANLDQIRSLYGIDVIALVSYDQVQFTDEGLLSLTYWTLIGAYIVSGEKNDTSTLMDTAVYDIASRKLLFRAPGSNNLQGRSTPVNLSEELRVDSRKSFEIATEDMINNLDRELTKFREKIKADPAKASVVYREGYAGGGGLGLFELLSLFALGLVRCRRREFRRFAEGISVSTLRSFRS